MMRTRYKLALLTVAGLAASGGLAHAAPLPTGQEPAPPANAHLLAAQPATVTLPTGDTVRVTGDGPVQLLPAPGREDIGYHTRRVPGASNDRVIVPVDVADDVARGEQDARLFNVDALLRNGVSDARTVTSPRILGETPLGWRSDEPSAADADTTQVTVDFSWLDGSVPYSASGAWLKLDNDEIGFFEAVDGSAELALAPGRYSIVVSMHTEYGANTPYTVVGTATDVTVADEPQVVPVDGREAQRLEFDLDRDAAPVGHDLEFFTNRVGSNVGPSLGFFVPGETQLYGIPSQTFADHAAGMVWRSELTDPAERSDAYSYSLMRIEENGIPQDLTFRVRDTELAVRETSYGSLGADASLARSNVAVHPDYKPFTWLPFGDAAAVATSSVRTEYYTADPDVSWSHQGDFSRPGTDAPNDQVLRHSGPMQPGSGDVNWLSAPLSVGVSDPTFPYFGSGVRRFNNSGSNVLTAFPPLFTSGAEDEFTVFWGLDGESVLSRDGEELAREEGPIVGAVLPDGDSGRYALSVDVSRQVPWTPLGTRSTARWEFESGPVDTVYPDQTAMNVSVVRFNASGIEDGFASADVPQRVELDYVTQPGAEHSACTAMTFEVSYDDGRTWRAVEITRDGDHATATLHHPTSARFVSVRFTAADEAGSTVQHSTIRSYGLR